MKLGPSIFPQSWNEWVDQQNIPWVSESWHEERRRQDEIEAQVAALEKEKQFNIDRMKSAEDLAMEKTWSMAGTRKAEAPSKNIATAAAKDLRDDEDMSLMQQAFLMSMIENLQGEDIGQSQAVVAGGGLKQWPTMMGQFAPWERQSPYRWLS
jgi:hypothetical protein